MFALLGPRTRFIVTHLGKADTTLVNACAEQLKFELCATILHTESQIRDTHTQGKGNDLRDTTSRTLDLAASRLHDN